MAIVSGIVRDSERTALAGIIVTITAARPVVGFSGGAVAQQTEIYTTSGTGLLTTGNLAPGAYAVTLSVAANASTSQTVLLSTTGIATEAETMTLEAFLAENALPVNSSILQQTVTARDEAVAAAAGITAVMAEIYPQLYNIISDRGLLLIAHRGFRNLYPQNTMLALSHAARIADAIECDVQVSADGTTWVFHDDTVDALTDGTGTFTALSDATIGGLSFDTFGLDADLVDMVKIPRFATLLQFAARNTVPIFPEIKGTRTDADVDLICSEVIAANVSGRTVLQSFSWTHVLRALNYDSRIKCGYLNTSVVLADLQYAVNTLEPFNGRGWLLTSHASLLAEPSIVAYAMARNVPIAAYTVVEQSDADYLQSIGVRAIMSDVALTGINQ